MKRKSYPCHLSVAVLASILLLLTSSCASTFHSSTLHSRNISANSIYETSNIADLKVGEQKVSGTATGNNVLDQTLKDLAIYDAVKKANADVLIEPSFDIEKTGNNTTVNVQGYPGTYKNFRKPTYQDSVIMGWKTTTGASAPAIKPATTTTTTITTTAPISLSTGQISGNNTPANQSAIANPVYSPLIARIVGKGITQAKPLLQFDANTDYQAERKKGKRLLGWGLGLFVTGAIVAGLSPLAIPQGNYQEVYVPGQGYEEPNNPVGGGFVTMVSVGGVMALTGLVMFPIGIKHLIKAKRIKNQSSVQNLDLTVLPDLNWASNRYGATVALKF